ncbi:hypothetical protein [Dictyobacter aurantiacus]|uniref:Uncharacterized protein n=1 Tax=Dictyobacter aurantiacus TaxID=1936993 RepID=A0A401ZGC0_9CHLR|nr:hypothetical protein [Dictyobacter aurantiacus]GCE05896.1 hypothetical protein KDAU_32250 [Dictyobacter aurantiacus]
MNAMAIGHAELYIYPEKVTPQDRISSPQRIDVTGTQELLEVLTSMPAETSFSVLLVINDCVVGNGKYFMTHETVTILHEYGACVGFLVKPLAILREARQEHQRRYSSGQDHVRE